MAEKSKWLTLIILILFSTTCSLQGNFGGDTTYTVRFDKNGGNGNSPSSQNVKTGSSVRLPSSESLSKSGFTFGGWNTEPSGDGNNYSADSFYTPTGNVTLYAKWIADAAPTYTVTFDGNGANGAPPVPQAAKAGSSIALPGGSGLTKSGYTFIGWNTDASGTGAQYSAGSSFTVNRDVILYANWVSPVTTYTVTFNANGGSGTPPAAQTVNAGSSITLPSGSGLSKSDSTFGGWNTNASGSGELYGVGSSYVPYSNITLYAKWNDIVTYTVTFNANGGSGTVPASQTAQSGSTITLPNGSGLTRSGFTFGGWNTDTSGTGTIYQPGEPYTVTGNITLYANWVPAGAVYTVTFNSNGGNGTVPASQTASAGSGIILPNEGGLSKNGFSFGGWNTNTSGTGTNYKAGDSYIVTGNVTLYAKWDPAVSTSYTVTYNANGGSGSVPASQTAQSGSTITLPNGTGLTKSGYTFGGWNTNTSGTGTNYKAGDSYIPTANITFYAKWEINTIDSVNGLAAKLSWLESNAVSGGVYTVEVSSNESIDPTVLSYSGKSNIAITLKGIGQGRIISLNSNGSMFTVGSGVTLILDNNIILTGRSSNTGALVYVYDGGSLVMNAGSGIINNTLSYGGISGVHVSGKFTMNGGKVSGNGNIQIRYSGGYNVVCVYQSGTFTMNGGEISGNTSNNGMVSVAGTFIMNGGTISGNTSSVGGGVAMIGGIPTGTFTMNGGEIFGNTSSSYGGGVYVGDTFTKTGGTIYGYTSGDTNSNVVKRSGVVQNYSGHAVWVNTPSTQRRETTAGPKVNLDSSKSGVAGGWE